MFQDFFHQPVLLKEAVDALLVKSDGIYVDCTLGGAGHSEEILKRLEPQGKLVCFDADPDAILHAKARLGRFSNVHFAQVFYDQLDVVLVQLNLLPVHGILFDLGISSYQVDREARGFSFQKDGPLDMRFNPLQKKTAEEVINEYPLEELERIFRNYGEERQWRAIARAVDNVRKVKRIRTTGEFAEVIRQAVPSRYINKTLARIFQAVRIEVNDELNRLQKALEKAFNVLDKSGRIVAIAYHSLEDRLIKDFFRYKELDCICPEQFPQCVCEKVQEMKILTRKPIYPSEEEKVQNPRARSARMRVAEKIVPFKEEW